MLPDVGMVKTYSKLANVDLGCCTERPPPYGMDWLPSLFAWSSPPPLLHRLPSHPLFLMFSRQLVNNRIKLYILNYISL